MMNRSGQAVSCPAILQARAPARRQIGTALMSDSDKPSPPCDCRSGSKPELTAQGCTVISNVVCPHCADLCDDLRLSVQGNQIAAVEVECLAARTVFLGYQVETELPRVRGAEAGWEAAIEEAVTILGHAVSLLADRVPLRHQLCQGLPALQPRRVHRVRTARAAGSGCRPRGGSRSTRLLDA